MKTESHIIIKNCSKEELKTMLNNWLEMYAAVLRSRMTFEVAETAPDSCVLKVDKGIDDTHFFYMVNYFSYPFNFKRTFEAEGYTTATKHKKLLGKNIYVFIDGKEYEHTNVRITTEEGETYKFDFGGTLKKMNAENNYKTWNATGLSIAYEQIHVDQKALLEEVARREDEKSRRGTAKRFKIILTLLFVLIPAAYLTNRYFPYTENGFLGWMSSLGIAMWFLMDYKIFYTPQRTFICVLLSLLNIVFWNMQMDSIDAMFVTLPLSSIIVMLILKRFLGTRIGRIQDSRWDRFFLMAQFLISLLITHFVFQPVLKYIKL